MVKKKSVTKREVKYEKFSVRQFVGDKAMTVVQAKAMLGWQEEPEDGKWGSDFLLKDLEGVKIRCANNVKNRPLYSAVSKTLTQEHLRKRWQLNGEPIIIGKTGLVLNGQHSLISLILAAQEREAHQEKWSEYWDVEPTMEKIVSLGVAETDDVVNTMDTCKPRSLADVIYRSAFFGSVQGKDRKNLARLTDYAIRQMWHRTGAKLNAYAPLRTHSESLDFIQRHPKLLDCVRHIYEENEANKIGRYISSGAAAGLLYLMAAGKTDAGEYHSDANPNEKQLDLSLWDTACNFWVELAGQSEKLQPFCSSFLRKHNDKEHEFGKAEREAMLIKAWLLYVADKPITAKDLKLSYQTLEGGWRELDECPICGGIDVGGPDEVNGSNTALQDAQDRHDDDIVDPTPEEIEQRTKPLRAEKEKATEPKTTKKKTGIGSFRPGKLAWVAEKEPWRGKIVEVAGKNAKLRVLTGHKGAGNIKPVAVTLLRVDQPNA